MKNEKKIVLAAIAALVLGSFSPIRAGDPISSTKTNNSSIEAKVRTRSDTKLTEEELIKKARMVDEECLANALRPNTVQRVSRGPDDRSMRIVRFSLDPACAVPPCPLFASQLISEVDFDSKDQVVSVKCFVTTEPQ
jgi:hypothetical protein